MIHRAADGTTRYKEYRQTKKRHATTHQRDRDEGLQSRKLGTSSDIKILKAATSLALAMAGRTGWHGC